MIRPEVLEALESEIEYANSQEEAYVDIEIDMLEDLIEVARVDHELSIQITSHLRRATKVRVERKGDLILQGEIHDPLIHGHRPGGAFEASLPCPDCGHDSLFGYLFRNEEGKHMHTHYVCTFWASGKPGGEGRCGWHGWSVPGWNKEED